MLVVAGSFAFKFQAWNWGALFLGTVLFAATSLLVNPGPAARAVAAWRPRERPPATTIERLARKHPEADWATFRELFAKRHPATDWAVFCAHLERKHPGMDWTAFVRNSNETLRTALAGRAPEQRVQVGDAVDTGKWENA